MLKKEIRKEFVAKRISIDERVQLLLDKNIIGFFTNLTLPAVQALLSYHPIAERREFDPSYCEHELRIENPQLRVYWPKLGADGVTMEAVMKDENTNLVKNIFDIPEPDSNISLDPLLLDIVFVPLLAFDKNGFRVGYGKGYYDRFLQRCKPGILKIGFSYFEPVPRIDDVDEYDIPLNLCITPERIYEF